MIKNKDMNTKKRIAIAFMVVGIFISGAVKAQKRRNIDTPATVVYALPQTVIKLDVTAQKTIVKRGPFADYAKKYLGISDVVRNDGVKWSIQSVTLSSEGEIDPKAYYKITTSKDYEPALIALTPEGLLKGFNVGNTQTDKLEAAHATILSNDVDMNYGKFSVDPILKFKKDTTYKIVETDTAFIKVPVLKKQAMLKSEEEKAAEAAHMIFKLRKRRFKILTANYKILPPGGNTYGVIVEQLAKLEADYMSMFIGKKVSVTQRFQFLFTPQKGSDSGVAFRLSPTKGPVTVSDVSGKPIRVEIKSLKTAQQISISATQNKRSAIYYRIPDMADVSIVDGRNVLVRKRMPIAQLGKIATLPTDVLLNEGYGIEFYPNLGSIKNIVKKRAEIRR